MSLYSYSITGSLPSGSVLLCELTEEITASVITSSELDYINRESDNLYVYFTSPLSVGDVTILNGIVGTHSATSSYCIIPEEILSDGSVFMSGSFNMGGNDIENVNLVDNVDVSNHSSRHILSGSDEIDGDQIAIDYNPSNYIPDFSITEATSSKHLSAHLAGIDNSLTSITFGSNFNYSESSGSFSTTSNTFQRAHRMNVPDIPTGLYRIGWNYFWRIGTTSQNIIVRIQTNDIVDLVSPYHSEEPKDAKSDQNIPASGYKYVNLSSGSHFIDIDIKSDKNGIESCLNSASFEMWKVS